MSCAYTEDAGAYVLGALSPQERLEFEQHCLECAACSASVRDLAGLPGLLSRADPSVLEAGPSDEAVPPVVLPTLPSQVRRGRRTRVRLLAGVAATLVAVGAAGTGVGVVIGRHEGAVTAAPANTNGKTLAMQPVRAAPATATVQLGARRWGTELHLTCAYAQGEDGYALPPEVTYLLVVRGRNGVVQKVGTWRALRGRTMQLSAATALTVSQIRSVEIRTEQGRTVLRTSAL